MSKYIYGTYDPDTFGDELVNEFHYLFMFLGAYLKYCKNSENYQTFDDYAKAKSISGKTDDRFRWCYINEAQAYLRDQLNSSLDISKRKISKREIRKLGYSGLLSVPMFPKSGLIIENSLFNYVFNNDKLATVKEYFLDYVSQKWKNDPERTGYNSGDRDARVRMTAIYFCVFQERVLQRRPDIKLEFQTHNTYRIMQEELERRAINARK